MKFYYKFISTAFFAIFMGFCTCIIVGIAVDKFRENFVEALPLLFFIALFGFISFLYGKMALMRLRKVPVIELTDNECIIRYVLKRRTVIPYKSVVGIRTDGVAGIAISYCIDNVKMKKNLSFKFVDADSSNIYDLITELENKINPPYPS